MHGKRFSRQRRCFRITCWPKTLEACSWRTWQNFWLTALIRPLTTSRRTRCFVFTISCPMRALRSRKRCNRRSTSSTRWKKIWKPQLINLVCQKSESCRDKSKMPTTTSQTPLITAQSKQTRLTGRPSTSSLACISPHCLWWTKSTGNCLPAIPTTWRILAFWTSCQNSALKIPAKFVPRCKSFRTECNKLFLKYKFLLPQNRRESTSWNNGQRCSRRVWHLRRSSSWESAENYSFRRRCQSVWQKYCLIFFAVFQFQRSISKFEFPAGTNRLTAWIKTNETSKIARHKHFVNLAKIKLNLLFTEKVTYFHLILLSPSHILLVVTQHLVHKKVAQTRSWMLSKKIKIERRRQKASLFVHYQRGLLINMQTR